MKVMILYSLNINFLAADGIGQNRLGNNRYIWNLNNRTLFSSDLLFKIMHKMKNSERGKKMLKTYFRTLRTKNSNTSRLFYNRKNFGY